MADRIPFSVITKKANKLLLDCGFDVNSIDVRKKNDISTDLAKIALCRNIIIRYHDFSDDISGVFFKKDGKLFLGVNDGHAPTRQRFTIAHEIGHHMLHTDDILHYDDFEKKNDEMYFRADRIRSSQETEANFFAAEILMPTGLIEKCVENGIEYVEDLAEAFKVSPEAMRYRLTNLGYL